MLSSIVVVTRARTVSTGRGFTADQFLLSLAGFRGLVPRVNRVADRPFGDALLSLQTGRHIRGERATDQQDRYCHPAEPNDPVFTGDIFIVENSWRIHSADLYITRAQQMEFVDTFRVRQNYLPIGQDLWMPFNNTINFSFSFLGFVGRGQILGIFFQLPAPTGVCGRSSTTKS